MCVYPPCQREYRGDCLNQRVNNMRTDLFKKKNSSNDMATTKQCYKSNKLFHRKRRRGRISRDSAVRRRVETKREPTTHLS